MSRPHPDADKTIATLVEITDAILRGEYDHDTSAIDTEGLLSTLAQKINAMLANLRMVETPLTSAGQQAPGAVQNARSVVELMAQSTEVVLDKSDKLVALTEGLNAIVRNDSRTPETAAALEENLTSLKATVFDIIASQSYQDAARQKMEGLINDLNQIRTWLLESLVILNIHKNDSPENVQQKTELLREVKKPASEPLNQDLVDDLLAEFGF